MKSSERFMNGLKISSFVLSGVGMVINFLIQTEQQKKLTDEFRNKINDIVKEELGKVKK